MTNTNPNLEMYTEQEAADILDISVSRLHALLDENIFNDGSPRPADLSFTSQEILLLGFWQRSRPNPKVVRMPRRP
jgi:hypothetical protein